MATQKKAPMARMKQDHQNKETLVDRILEAIERGDADKDALKTKLLAVSNRKLLRLCDAAHEVKTKFGSREKVAEAIAGAVGKAKDKDYIAKLSKYTAPRLMAMHRSVVKGAKQPAA